MKNNYFIRKAGALLLLVFIGCRAEAQNAGQVLKELKSLEIPHTPSNVLLDNAPTSIEHYNTVQAISLGIINDFLTSNSFAVQVVPFWFLKHAGYDDLRYYGFKSGDTTSYNPLSQLRQIAISAAYVKDQFNDAVIDQGSFGFRTRILQFKNKVQRRDYLTYRRDIFTQVQSFADMTALNRNLKLSDFNIESNFQVADQPSIFSLDLSGALAYGGPRATFDDDAAITRAGIWTTAALQTGMGKSKDSHISIVFLARWLHTDTDSFFLTSFDNSLDLGVKAELRYRMGTISFEYINRDNEDSEESYQRYNGIISYSLSPEFGIVGTFGENFTKDKSLALLGISWKIQPK
jgi:hypothetical protein